MTYKTRRNNYSEHGHVALEEHHTDVVHVASYTWTSSVYDSNQGLTETKVLYYDLNLVLKTINYKVLNST
jgi:hypothetical protein